MQLYLYTYATFEYRKYRTLSFEKARRIPLPRFGNLFASLFALNGDVAGNVETVQNILKQYEMNGK